MSETDLEAAVREHEDFMQAMEENRALRRERDHFRAALVRIGTTPVWGPDHLQQIARDALNEVRADVDGRA